MNLNKLSLIIFALFFFACSTSFEDVENNPIDNFNFVWKTLDERFSLFEINNVEDWDQVYQELVVKIDPNMSDDSLHSVLNDLLWKLKDRHSSINSPFDYRRRFVYDLNFSYDLLEKNYLFTKNTSGPLQYSTLDGNIGYIYISTFGRTITKEHVSKMIDDLSGTNGIIIDIRENGGGNELHSQRVAEVFCDEKRLYRITYTKSGPAHNAFEKNSEVYIHPDGEVSYNKPIVLITNKGTYSASTDFVLMMKQFPQVTILGDSIGGGLGTPTFAQMPNGWNFRFSSSYSLDPDGNQFENGMPPDSLIYLDTLQSLNNIDNIIESAKVLILE